MGEKKVAETLYKYLLNKPINRYFGHDIKWLERDDSDIFNNPQTFNINNIINILNTCHPEDEAERIIASIRASCLSSI